MDMQYLFERTTKVNLVGLSRQVTYELSCMARLSVPPAIINMAAWHQILVPWTILVFYYELILHTVWRNMTGAWLMLHWRWPTLTSHGVGYNLSINYQALYLVFTYRYHLHTVYRLGRLLIMAHLFDSTLSIVNYTFHVLRITSTWLFFQVITLLYHIYFINIINTK
jgi:hypothetical protein